MNSGWIPEEFYGTSPTQVTQHIVNNAAKNQVLAE